MDGLNKVTTDLGGRPLLCRRREGAMCLVPVLGQLQMRVLHETHELHQPVALEALLESFPAIQDHCFSLTHAQPFVNINHSINDSRVMDELYCGLREYIKLVITRSYF